MMISELYTMYREVSIMEKRRQETLDGNTAAAYISYAFTEMATIFPITPSSVMAEEVDEWAALGKKNIFGNTVTVREMQSEKGASAAMHGSLQSGALTTTYTASQGLMLMLPVMFRIAGELLPGVYHVASRAVGNNGFSIFGDHQDVMAVRTTGSVMISSGSVQECMDLGAVAHLSAIKCRLPVVHFFDGFRTSHEIQKIDMLEYDEMKEIIDMDAVNAFRARAMSPDDPVLRGCTQNPDVYFQQREAVNKFYMPVADTVQHYMDEINKLTGREYKLFNYYGAEDAESIIVSMGSSCSVIRETIDFLNRQGRKYGLLQVHLYRPFAVERFLDAMPAAVKRIAVLDRTKEPGANGEPLYQDVCTAFSGSGSTPLIIGGRYGIASKDFTPANVMEVYKNLEQKDPQDHFTVGIVDNVTFTSLPPLGYDIDTKPEGLKECKFWGFGSDGTVGANKAAIKIIGNHTDMYAQAYFAYDSKKSGGLTVSHLRFGTQPIQSSYQVHAADFIACHNQSYVDQYDMVKDLRMNGKFLLNCEWSADELNDKLPDSMKKTLLEKNAEFYIIDAAKVAEECGLGGRINMIMQTAFFKLADIIPIEDAVKYLKDAVEKNYSRKGREIVENNDRAIDSSLEKIVKVDAGNISAGSGTETGTEDYPEYYKNFVLPILKQEGDDLPVSAFVGYEDGTYEIGTTKYEKRGISLHVPAWDAEKCIQCNRCSFVCPHAVLRPKLLTEQQVSDAPVEIRAAEAKGYKDRKYVLAISALDCTGCGSCTHVCPAKEKAISLVPLSDRDLLTARWEYLNEIEEAEIAEKQRNTVKGSQFLQPLLEFSGACAGCAETPYAKLITQLYGDRMVNINTAGCAAVWGGSSPTISYTKNRNGHGPCFGYSLFENEAEYGFGMYMGANEVRKNLAREVGCLVKADIPDDVREAMQEWLDGFDDPAETRERADKLETALERYKDDSALAGIYGKRHYFIKRSWWILGGDGWAYDIGFGGLDHVMAYGENINVFVFDTEVYSNTGGQSSKSTPVSAVAKFAAAGKKTKKKDLGRMAMSYGYIYVAQVCMGADMEQTVKAITEAERYNGPSLIIGYSPCINHGVKAGMGNSQIQQKRAVESGYWALYRYNPEAADNGENPFTLDSKDPSASFRDYLMSETRFTSLMKTNPDQAEQMFEKCEKDAMDRIAYYKKLDAER